MKPENIILVRHGQSTGNANRLVYKTVPDYAVPLSETGVKQAREVGEKLFWLLGDFPIQFYVSPFWRTRQTYLCISKHFTSKDSKFSEEPRLREQEWGHCDSYTTEDYKTNIIKKRDEYGPFYYRFPDGESCADVYDRVSDFFNTLHRDFEKPNFPKNVVIVTHGMTMRLFLMKWFHYTVDEFETWGNPKNCEYWHLKLNPETNKYKLLSELRTRPPTHNYKFDWKCMDNV
jgi:broad specificity phosphatase PhoE